MESTLKKVVMKGSVKNIVTIDPEAFKAKVQEYIDMSPVSKEWADVLNLKWPEDIKPPQLFDTFSDIVKVVTFVCSAVEVAKHKLIKEQDPDGTKGAKFDNAIALGAAVDIISSLIVFKGPSWFPGFVTLLHKFWKPALNICVSVFVSQQPAGWVAIALKLLQVAMA